MDKDEMRRRTKAFALSVMSFCRHLPRSAEAAVIARQLLRCGTSVGANYRAACLARSRADFISKMGIVLEEVDESRYWMELLVEGKLSEPQTVREIMREAAELTSIVAASIITARERQKARATTAKP